MAERAHPEDPGFQNKWFGLKRNVYRENMFKRYAFCNQFIKDKTVLDIPCGVGWGTSTLKRAKKIYGVDIAPDAIEYASNHFKKKNIEYQVGDMVSMPFPDAFFDVVICLEGFEHVAREISVSFIREAQRVLKMDGLLIMTTPLLTEGKHSGNPYHLFEPSIEEFSEIVQDNFETVHLEIFQGPESQVVKFVGRN